MSDPSVKPDVPPAREAEWDTAYINDLPDDAFAYIQAGGEKDEKGKTVPRSLRNLPYKNAQGTLDPDHVRNALARLPQTEISAEAKAEAKRKLCAAAKELDIRSEVCDLADTEETKKVLELLNQGVLAELAEARAQVKALQDQVKLLEGQKSEALTAEIIQVRKAKAQVEADLAEAKTKLLEATERENTLRGSVLEALKHTVFERIPAHWGVGPTQMNLKLKHLITDLERGGAQP